MLFQSDYWVASSYQEKLETIAQFVDTDEGITVMFILDVNITADVPSILEDLADNDDLPCIINLITESGSNLIQPTGSLEDCHTKTIYVRNSIDTDSLNIMRNNIIIFKFYSAIRFILGTHNFVDFFSRSNSCYF